VGIILKTVAILLILMTGLLQKNMKHVTFETVAILLIMTMWISSCGKKNNEHMIDISLDYANCPCEHETKFLEKRTYENILMFNIAKTSLDEIRKIAIDGQRFGIYVIADFETKTAGLNIYAGTFYTGMTICNFPANKISQAIPENGLLIYMAGDIYETCEPQGFIPEHSYFNIVLTSLKIQQQ
jgi:hypothetical protein